MIESKHELIELAAKAAGYEVAQYEGNGCVRVYDPECVYAPKTTFGWYPLYDDGDALRLAVQCKLYVFTTGEGYVGVSRPVEPYINISQKVNNCDWYTATRLAIVRAAAEIGRKMT